MENFKSTKVKDHPSKHTTELNFRYVDASRRKKIDKLLTKLNKEEITENIKAKGKQ